MHRTRPGGLNGGEMYGTRAGLPILLLLWRSVIVVSTDIFKSVGWINYYSRIVE